MSNELSGLRQGLESSKRIAMCSKAVLASGWPLVERAMQRQNNLRVLTMIHAPAPATSSMPATDIVAMLGSVRPVA